ncbi:hypothetical protein MOD15_14020 [Bacillus haynesii]|uniref:hypothetical protein n=1 Tax=Bacillus haynesii TaxID=1925021 RepID=UPI00227F69C2|nr:hypothetical protein [Bacillus haynesii]MCY8470107.1 hypothetical protein [Bacillus haynesii]
MNKNFSEHKNVITYLKNLEKVGGFNKTFEGQKGFKNEIKEKHKTKSELLTIKERCELEVETNKDTSFFYNHLFTILITFFSVMSTLIFCFLTVGGQVLNTAINNKVSLTLSDDKYKHMSLDEKNEIMKQIFNPIIDGLNNLILQLVFGSILIGAIILVIGLFILERIYRARIKRARYYSMIIKECISDIDEKTTKQKTHFRRKIRR